MTHGPETRTRAQARGSQDTYGSPPTHTHTHTQASVFLHGPQTPRWYEITHIFNTLVAEANNKVRARRRVLDARISTVISSCYRVLCMIDVACPLLQHASLDGISLTPSIGSCTALMELPQRISTERFIVFDGTRS